MFVVNKDLSIYATRGDIVFFKVTAHNDGEAYKFQPGDVIRMKIFEKKGCDCVVMHKDFPVEAETEEVEVFLTEKDTRIGKLISKPVDYWYEIELNPLSNPQTIVGYDEDGAKVFKLFPEGKPLDDGEIEPEDIPIVDKELDATSTRPVQNQAIAVAIQRVSAQAAENKQACARIEGAVNAHNENKENPHGVTKKQVGLGNVPNVATDDQTPTFEQANDLGNLVSGEKLSALFGKLAKGMADLIAHLRNVNNPHNVTAAQVKARPDTWMPTLEEMGAAPADHATDKNNPHSVTASQVGATPASHLSDKNNPHGVTAAQVGARPDTWTPTASEVGARPNTWMPTAADVGASAPGHKHSAADVTSGILPYARGGTGKALGDVPNYAIMRNAGDGDYMWYLATGNGALHATATNGAPKFGTLPIAQGGTGATSAASARSKLGTNMTLLWTNASPTSSYTSFTPLSLDLSAYTAIVVWYRLSHEVTQHISSIVPVGVGSGTSSDDVANATTCFAAIDSKWVRRYCFASKSAVTFGAGGYRTSVSSNYTVDSKYMIPERIYGIR